MNNIHSSEIWTKTSCLDKETEVNLNIRSKLENLGYTLCPTDYDRYTNHKQTVINCIVDDWRSRSNEYHDDTPYLFNRNTIILTDNRVNCPTQYKIHQLPESFFGIYSYIPENNFWNPTRDFCFSVNRIDDARFKLLLELGWRVHLDRGWVNFNCEMRYPSGTGTVITNSRDLFDHLWEDLDPQAKSIYEKSFELLAPQMPLKNYEMSHEIAHISSFLNIVVETYHGDNNIALSEKTFRALVTPVPWTIYSSRYTVAYLESMGFDCLSDIIGHNHYDRLKNVENKINIFIWKSLDIVKWLKQQNFESLKIRCKQAADHNQELLKQMSKQWPDDFNQWLKNLPSQLDI